MCFKGEEAYPLFVQNPRRTASSLAKTKQLGAADSISGWQRMASAIANPLPGGIATGFALHYVSRSGVESPAYAGLIKRQRDAKRKGVKLVCYPI
ncbi:MAG TPA: hypothetical protein DCP08_10340 [Chloroflexi bacterium]|nr:hypothetical protein [Chloroflexota bacterium]